MHVDEPKVCGVLRKSGGAPGLFDRAVAAPHELRHRYFTSRPLAETRPYRASGSATGGHPPCPHGVMFAVPGIALCAKIGVALPVVSGT